MAIASFKPDAPRNKAYEVPTASSDTLIENYVDDHVEPISHLLPFVEGTAWNVDYYHALIGQHTDLTHLDVSTPASHQSYELIRGFPLMVNSSLTQSFNKDTAVSSVTGSARMNYHIVPNVGDVFLAGAAIHKVGFYQVTGVERLSFNKTSVYQIDYQLLGVDDQITFRINNLNLRTLRIYHYEMERGVDGLSPIVTDDIHHARAEIARLYGVLSGYYYKTFFQHGPDTFLLPGTTYKVVDNELIQFVKAVITKQPRYTNYLSTMEQGVSINRHLTTLYDVLMLRDIDSLGWAAIKRVAVDVRGSISYSSVRSSLGQLGFMNCDYLIAGEQAHLHPDLVLSRAPTDIITLGNTHNVNGFAYVTPKSTIVDGEGVSYFPTFQLFESYVLPEVFYTQQQITSVLERQLIRSLKRQALSPVEIHHLLKVVREYPLIEQFYFIPLVCYLAMTCLKSQ